MELAITERSVQVSAAEDNLVLLFLSCANGIISHVVIQYLDFWILNDKAPEANYSVSLNLNTDPRAQVCFFSILR